MGYINISPPSGLQRNKGESGGGSDAATAAALAPLSKGRAHISLACYGTEITDEILKRGKKCISSGNSKIDKKKNNGRNDMPANFWSEFCKVRNACSSLNCSYFEIKRGDKNLSPVHHNPTLPS